MVRDSPFSVSVYESVVRDAGEPRLIGAEVKENERVYDLAREYMEMVLAP
jgi:fructose-specific component phosphotransferase system IIB-like protein